MRFTPDTSPTTPKERMRGRTVLFLSLTAVGMGQTLFNAVLPPIARDLGMTEVQTSMIFALSAVAWMIMSPIWGRYSDRIGRKPVIIIGVAGFGISTLGFSLVIYAGIHGLLAGVALILCFIGVRTIFGVFGSGTMPAANGYIADRTTRQERSAGIAQVAAAFGVGIVIGPMIAGTLLQFGKLVPFMTVAALALSAAIAVAIYLPERSKPQSSAGRNRPATAKLRYFDGRVLPLVLISLAISFSQSIQVQATGFYFMDNLGFAPEEAASFIAVGFAVMGLSGLFAQFVIIQRFQISVQTMLRMGSILAIACFAIFVLFADFGLTVMALMLSGIGFGLIRPGLSSAASLSVDPDEQGGVAGIIGSTAAVGHVLNPIIGMPLYEYDPRAPFLLAGVLIGLSLLAIVTVPRIRNIRAEDETHEEIVKDSPHDPHHPHH